MSRKELAHTSSRQCLSNEEVTTVHFILVKRSRDCRYSHCGVGPAFVLARYWLLCYFIKQFYSVPCQGNVSRERYQVERQRVCLGTEHYFIGGRYHAGLVSYSCVIVAHPTKMFLQCSVVFVKFSAAQNIILVTLFSKENVGKSEPHSLLDTSNFEYGYQR